MIYVSGPRCDVGLMTCVVAQNGIFHVTVLLPCSWDQCNKQRNRQKQKQLGWKVAFWLQHVLAGKVFLKDFVARTESTVVMSSQCCVASVSKEGAAA